jgi:membrane fusion protein (multidrug efflux system)
MAKLVIRLLLVLIVAAGAVGGGAYWWKTGRFQESTDNAYIEGDISVISPLIEGKVATVAVGDNQAVKAGDVLVTIESDDFRAKVAEAQATVAAADASIGTIDSQITWQQTKIDQIVAQQRSAGAELTRAKTVYERYKKLIESKVIGTQDLDEATAAYVKAQAAVSETSAQLAAEQTQLGVYQASRKEAEAKQMEAKATLKLAEINLDRTVIKAPIDGVVGNRGVRVGQYVKAGSQLLSLVPTDVHVVANFKETHQDRPPRAGAHPAPREQPAARPAAAGPLGRGRCRHPHRPHGAGRDRQGAEDRARRAAVRFRGRQRSAISGLSEE